MYSLGGARVADGERPGRTPGPGPDGPDVIAADIWGVGNWGLGGAVRGYSLATTACNLGSAPADWFAGPDPAHPVIAQHMYRLKDGRFEQIGQSWVKHGFCALQNTVCGGCDAACPGGCCTQLGVGCSDSYSSSMNGEWTRLGPKSEIDPLLGTNLGNHALAEGMTNVRGRLQVHQVDVDSSNEGAVYFGEAQYIAADDAQAGGGWNNASYRELDVNHVNFNIVVAPVPAVRELPAIYAWQAEDPGVVVEIADIPGGGRLHLAHRAWPAVDGWWHYEYALHNLNSVRAVRAFGVPLGSGVELDAIGFHDVDYHSGEPYAATDWAPATTDGTLSWSTDPFDVDPNANALRWGTLYNFRFKADTPPAPAPVTIGLFVPGVPESLTVAALAPSDAPFCSGPGDCSDADGDGVRDDPCVWWECTGDACLAEDIVYGDMGGPFGICAPDGVVDSHDRFHALNCFSNTDTLGQPLAYPCEEAPPAAFNVDAAGFETPCTPDGVCDANDAFAALNAFVGIATCSCPSG